MLTPREAPRGSRTHEAKDRREKTRTAMRSNGPQKQGWRGARESSAILEQAMLVRGGSVRH